MTVAIMYNATTGIIEQVTSVPLSNQAQREGLKARGFDFIDDAPDGTNSDNSIVNLDDRSLIRIAPRPFIPNLIQQYIAAQIKAGAVSADEFHPTTLADLNDQLTKANLTPAPTKGGTVL